MKSVKGEMSTLLDEDGEANSSDTSTLIGDDYLNACIESSTKHTNTFALALAVGNAADAVEILCVGYIMSELDDKISTTDKELLSAAVFIGMLVGGLLCGIMSDRVGRKPCLQFSLFLNAIAGLASAVAPNITWLIVIRVIGGIGIGGSVPSVFTLGAEIFPSSIRGKMLSVIASFWMVGAIYTALAGWLMLGKDLHGGQIMPGVGWRVFALVCTAPAAVALFLSLTVLPESPRFLMGQQRYDEAAAALSLLKGCAVDAKVLEQTDMEADSSKGTGPSVPAVTIVHLFEPALRPSTLVYMFIWFSLSFGSYGLSTWITVLFEDIGLGNVYASAFIFAMANLPGNVASLLYIDTIGRKRFLTTGMVLAALSAVGFAEGTTMPAMVILCATLFNAFSVAGWNALDCMSVENFPTEVRTSAMGVLAASGRIGAICAQFVNGSLEKNVPLLLFVTSGCMLLGGVAAMFTPHDATGKSLADHVL